jgi:hypothetical protein
LGDALGIGSGIIRPAGGVGNAVQVAAAHAVTALGVGATVGDAAIPDGATDGLLANALFVGRFMYVDLGVQVSSCCGKQFPQEGEPSSGGLFGTVLAQRFGLALRFENEGSEPGRDAVWQVETNRPSIRHVTSRGA